MSLEISDFLKKFRDLITANAALTAFATEKYGKAPFVFVGVDTKAPPEESTMPHIILLPGDPSSEEGVEAATCIYRVEILWAVKDESVTESVNMLEALGVYNSDRFGKLIWESIRRFSSNCPASKADFSVEGAAFAPIYPGSMLIEIRVPVVMGATITI